MLLKNVQHELSVQQETILKKNKKCSKLVFRRYVYILARGTIWVTKAKKIELFSVFF